MPQYMLLLFADPSQGPAEGSPEAMAEWQAWGTYTQGLEDAGPFVDGNPLEPPTTATRCACATASRSSTDGPFAETKEMLGGYYVVDCDDLDAGARRRGAHPERALRRDRGAPGRADVRPGAEPRGHRLALPRGVGRVRASCSASSSAISISPRRSSRTRSPPRSSAGRATACRTTRARGSSARRAQRAIDRLRRRARGDRARAPARASSSRRCAAPTSPSATVDQRRAARPDLHLLPSGARARGTRRAHAAPRRPDGRGGRPRVARAADDRAAARARQAQIAAAAHP